MFALCSLFLEICAVSLLLVDVYQKIINAHFRKYMSFNYWIKLMFFDENLVEYDFNIIPMVILINIA